MGVRRSRVVAAAVVVVAVVAFFVLGGYRWLRGDENVEDLLTGTGVVGPLVFVGVMWATQPFGVPGFVYMAPAGLVWPNPLAIALCWVGNMGASFIAFMFARWIARDWVSGRVPERMRRFDDRLENDGLAPVVLLRLAFGQIPAADWLLGVTRVTNRNFLVGTGLGIIPGVVIFVVAGGGILDALGDVPGPASVAALVVIAVALVGLRLWRRGRVSP